MNHPPLFLCQLSIFRWVPRPFPAFLYPYPMNCMFPKFAEFMMFRHGMISAMNLHGQISIFIIEIIVHLFMWTGLSIMHNHGVRCCMSNGSKVSCIFRNPFRDDDTSLLVGRPVSISCRNVPRPYIFIIPFRIGHVSRHTDILPALIPRRPRSLGLAIALETADYGRAAMRMQGRRAPP